MKLIKIFYDLETTGTNFRKHSIHQLAGIIEVDGEVMEEFNISSRPHPKAIIEPEALSTCRKTLEEIMAYQDMKEAFKQFRGLVTKYIDPFNTEEKAYLVGFNNRFFDDPFLRAWFEQNGDQFYGSLFWVNSLDAMVLASQYLIDRRPGMSSFKLNRVAWELGIEVDSSKLHDAVYDVYLTRQIYRIVTGLEVEI